MTVEEKAAHDALISKVNEMIADAQKSKADATEIEALNSQLKVLETKKESVSKEDYDKVKDEVVKMAAEFKAFKEQPNVQLEKGTKKAITKWIKENEEALKSIRAGAKSELTALVVKVATSPMLPANTLGGSAYLPAYEVEAGINDIVRVQPTFWDYIKKGRTSRANYMWINKTNPQGAAGFIAPGVLKPSISFEISTETSNAKKIAAKEKVATELLEDIEGMQSWIEQELLYAVRNAMNLALMTGVSSATNPAGIQTLSVPYTLLGVETTNPNNWDAIRAGIAQLRSGNLGGPVTVFVNPVDNANMELTKAITQGQLFVPSTTGATIVEDNNVPVGYVQIALLDYYKVLIYKDFAVTFGWENDDFSKNLVTVIGEMRIHQFFSENYTGAFIYDTFANIKAAITEI